MTGQLLPFGVEDFADSLQGHMPTGLAWPRDADATQRAVVLALSPTYARNWATAQAVLDDAFPATAVFLLPEWEASLGLPDPCAGEDQTVAARQAHVVARLTEQDGPSVPSLTAYAATLGYDITIEEFAPSRFGQDFGMNFGGDDWAHAWQVDAPSFEVDQFTFGANVFGDPFAEWGNTVLQCELLRIKPAHTVLSFVYGAAALDGFFLDESVLQ